MAASGKSRIPWDDEDEIALLKQLVEDKVDWDEITKRLNEEFRDQRPKNAEGKRIRRSRDSIYWFYQRLGRKENENKDESKKRQRRKQALDMSAPSNGYKITVTDSTGTVVCLFTTEKSIDAVNGALKELF